MQNLFLAILSGLVLWACAPSHGSPKQTTAPKSFSDGGSRSKSNAARGRGIEPFDGANGRALSGATVQE